MNKKIDNILTMTILLGFLVGFVLAALRINGGMQTMITSALLLLQSYLLGIDTKNFEDEAQEDM